MNSLILKFILYAGVVIGIIILLIMPALSSAVQEQYELTLAMAKLDALNKEKMEIQSLVQNVQSVEEEDNKDDAHLPVNRAIASYPDIHDIILSFEEIGGISGLEHVTVEPSIHGTTAEGHEGIYLIDVSVQATGDYERLVTFLKNLENAGRVFTIHSISLKNSSDSTTENEGNEESDEVLAGLGDAPDTQDQNQEPVIEITISGVVYYSQQ